MEKMIAVGIVWGATNAIMRRGALLWDEALKSSAKPHPHSTLCQKMRISVGNWAKLLSIWQYSIPFLINLSASATFFAILSDAPLSLAVPVTNATTFAATAVFGILLGERTHLPRAFFVAPSGSDSAACISGKSTNLLGDWRHID
ncbi:transmembrane protein 234 homolog isoform X2 [Glycine max]|uniref:transmembrane protein 234 homolog isoform X2 n=1 Tax=Glycine max TaxID=3847 RepID=UPI001B3565F9|nr:transmembrane protein 234 homolog isoform X2 [Glycine max]